MSIKIPSTITTVLLDIEGTVCPITFVKEGLFPYFLNKLPSVLAAEKFPLQASNSTISSILVDFPEETKNDADTLEAHIKSLVKNDIKEKTLKSLQGLVWQGGYDSGEIKAPLYPDAISSIKKWNSEGKDVLIYSSGSVKAQKLLFGHVDVNGVSTDMNGLLKGYFDITTSGYKFEKESYSNILKDLNKEGKNVLFLSDNVKEVRAAMEAGMFSLVAVRDGNAEISEHDKQDLQLVDDFTQIDI